MLVHAGHRYARTTPGVPAAKDIRFVLHVLDFFGVKINTSVPLLIDNAGMWFNIRNEGVSGWTDSILGTVDAFHTRNVPSEAAYPT